MTEHQIDLSKLQQIDRVTCSFVETRPNIQFDLRYWHNSICYNAMIRTLFIFTIACLLGFINLSLISSSYAYKLIEVIMSDLQQAIGLFLGRHIGPIKSMPQLDDGASYNIPTLWLELVISQQFECPFTSLKLIRTPIEQLVFE